MTRPGRYPAEIRERAVRMVLEHQAEHPSQWATITSIASKFGMTPETLRHWVRAAEVDGGARPGLTGEERARLRELERENRELRRANEILKAASAFFARELDPRLPTAGASRSSRSAGSCRSPRPRTTPPGSAGRRHGGCGTKR
jgi:transposase